MASELDMSIGNKKEHIESWDGPFMYNLWIKITEVKVGIHVHE